MMTKAARLFVTWAIILWVIAVAGLSWATVCTNCVPRIEAPPPITYYCRRIVPTLVGYRCLRSSARSITIVGVP